MEKAPVLGAFFFCQPIQTGFMKTFTQRNSGYRRYDESVEFRMFEKTCRRRRIQVILIIIQNEDYEEISTWNHYNL